MPPAPFRFIHTSDLHLGKSFRSLGEDKAARLNEARRTVFSRIAAAAVEHGAGHVLVAGDVFNTTTPTRWTLVQAAKAMGGHDTLRWWIIPGNHDRAAVRELWDAFASEAPGNVRVLTACAPVEMEPGAWLLPSPLTHIRSADDPTAWMDLTDTPEGAIRIGLAHGTVFVFSCVARPDLIAMDRAASARLDYLALGDRHTDLGIGPRTFYSGSPERDRVEDCGRGVVLAVTVPAPGVMPEVLRKAVGAVDWREGSVTLLPGDDPVGALEAVLPQAGRADIVMRVKLSGRIGLDARQSLAAHAEAVADAFLHLELDAEALKTDVTASDIDAFGLSGTGLRLAAEELTSIVEDGCEQSDVAARALDRLYAYVRQVAA